MGSFVGYKCSICSSAYQPDEVTYTCPKDNGILDVVLDYPALKKKSTEELILKDEPSLVALFSADPC